MQSALSRQRFPGLHNVFRDPSEDGLHVPQLAPPEWVRNVDQWRTGLAQHAKEQERFEAPPLVSHEGIQSIIDDMLYFVQRDYIQAWYHNAISRDLGFINSSNQVLHDVVATLVERVVKWDVTQFVTSKALPILTAHISEYRLAERAMKSKLRGGGTQQQVELALVGAYRAGHLHPATSAEAAPTLGLERAYLRQVVAKLLPLLGKTPLARRELDSKIVTTLVREILACKILQPVIEMLSDADFWNKAMELVADKMAVQDQSLVHDIREVLDTQKQAAQGLFSTGRNTMGWSATGGSDEEATFDLPRMQTFDEFIKQIKGCNNLPEALSIRDMILGELSKKQSEISDFRPSDIVHGVRVADTRVYINRLQVALRRVDKRIVGIESRVGRKLSTGSRSPRWRSSGKGEKLQPAPRMSLRAMLEDPMALSFLTEFMDQEGRMGYLQVWVVIDGFKGTQGDSKFNDSAEETLHVEDLPSADWTSVLDDIRSVTLKCFGPDATSPTLIAFPTGLRNKIDALVTTVQHEVNIDAHGTKSALQTLLAVQNHAFSVMERRDYPKFCSSGLYLQFLASIREGEVSPIRGKEQKDRFLPSNKSGSAKVDAYTSEKSPSRTSMESANSSVATGATSSPRKLNRFDSFLRKLSSDNLAVLPGKPGNDNKSLRTPSREDLDSECSTSVEGLATKETVADFEGIHNGELLARNEDDLMSSSDENDGFPVIPGTDVAERKVIGSGTPNNIPHDSSKSQAQLHSSDVATTDILNALGSPAHLTAVHARIQRLMREESDVAQHIKQVEREDAPSDRLRELELMRLGLASLLRQAIEEQKKLEEEEMHTFISPERTRVSIDGTRTLLADGKEFSAYIIHVAVYPPTATLTPQRQWVLTRRYSEFLALHRILRVRYPAIQRLDFPKKVIKGILKLKKELVDQRRNGLEAYLKQILQDREVCESMEVRRFLCEEQILAVLVPKYPPLPTGNPPGLSKGKLSLVKSLFQGGEGGFEPAFRRRSGEGSGYVSEEARTPEALARSARASVVTQEMSDEEDGAKSLKSSNDRLALDLSRVSKTVDSPSTATTLPFSPEPLSSTLSVLFDLREKNNWLRRQAVGLVLQQVFGGAVERRVNEWLDWLVGAENVQFYLGFVRETLWPGISLPTPSAPAPRTSKDIQRTAQAAHAKILALIPDLLGNMVGRKNAKRGAQRLWSVFQYRRLNQQIAYTLLDAILEEVMPEITSVLGRPSEKASTNNEDDFGSFSQSTVDPHERESFTRRMHPRSFGAALRRMGSGTESGGEKEVGSKSPGGEIKVTGLKRAMSVGARR
ncbi:PXA domain-containing protein [Phlyctochytrium arcticum]|nr:PXA domain-containing protein [Phlyctochytrium arcticum]